MTVPQTDIPFRSFGEIANASDHFMTVSRSGSYYRTLKSAKRGTALRQIYRQVQRNEQLYTYDSNCDVKCRNNILQVKYLTLCTA